MKSSSIDPTREREREVSTGHVNLSFKMLIAFSSTSSPSLRPVCSSPPPSRPPSPIQISQIRLWKSVSSEGLSVCLLCVCVPPAGFVEVVAKIKMKERKNSRKKNWKIRERKFFGKKKHFLRLSTIFFWDVHNLIPGKLGGGDLFQPGKWEDEAFFNLIEEVFLRGGTSPLLLW